MGCERDDRKKINDENLTAKRNVIGTYLYIAMHKATKQKQPRHRDIEQRHLMQDDQQKHEEKIDDRQFELVAKVARNACDLQRLIAPKHKAGNFYLSCLHGLLTHIGQVRTEKEHQSEIREYRPQKRNGIRRDQKFSLNQFTMRSGNQPLRDCAAVRISSSHGRLRM